MSARVWVSVSVDSASALARLGMGPGGALERRLAERVRAACEPYVPKRTGRLIASARAEGGAVRYTAPYARSVYYGVSASGKEMTYSGAPMRGRLWLERMKADGHAEAIAAALLEGGEE